MKIFHTKIKKMQKIFREIEDSNSYILLVLWSQIENVEKGFSIIYPDVLFQPYWLASKIHIFRIYLIFEVKL